MYYPLAAGAQLYRVTGAAVAWPTPLLGLGAYFTKGGRYNYAAEPTVYCAEDPLVVIAEAAFYQALEWQGKISTHRFNPVTYPLVSTHKLWGFTIDPSPTIIDLSDPHAVALFHYPPHMLTNLSYNPAASSHTRGQPLARDYFGTQDIAREVRGHVPPPGSADPRPEGVKAPAIRIKRIANYDAHQLALFVFDPVVHQPYQNRSTLTLECNLELKFLEAHTGQPVTSQTVHIDWSKPRFRLTGVVPILIPAYAPRLGSKAYNSGPWYTISLQYA